MTMPMPTLLLLSLLLLLIASLCLMCPPCVSKNRPCSDYSLREMRRATTVPYWRKGHGSERKKM